MIFRNPLKLKVFLRPGHTDMRKSWNGLYSLIKEELKRDPFSESMFVFSGHSRKLIKIFYWDGNGFCIWQKKLEKCSFAWPDINSKKVEISRKELQWLLTGIDFRKEHSILTFSNKS